MSVDCVLVGSDGEGQKCYWGGKGKIVHKLSEAKVYSDYQAAERACKRIKKAKFFYNDVEAEQAADEVEYGINTAYPGACCRCGAFANETFEGDGKKYCWGCYVDKGYAKHSQYEDMTKEPVQAVCFSAQPVMSSEEVPVLEDETLCDGCHQPESQCYCEELAFEQAAEGDISAMQSLGYTSQTIAWVEAGEVEP